MPAPELVGRHLDGFVIRELIGEGGFGEVYRAEQPGLAREAVVKILKASMLDAEEIVERFTREAQLASRLDHPYAAHVYAFGAEPDGRLWIAMELVRGTPLDRLIRAQGHMPLESFVPFFDRVAEVVRTAHDVGIIHRDIKPANVMVLTRAGRLLPKLLDFGIAKVVDAVTAAPMPMLLPARLAFEETFDSASAALGGTDVIAASRTRRGSIIGTPPFMAPELWNGDEVDGSTDQYALAVLAYNCLTGRLPFEQHAIGALAQAHLELPFPPVGPELPAALDAVFARAAAKQRADRYPDVLAFAAALRAASGVGGTEDVPGLSPEIRDSAAILPAPIADAVAAIASARNARAVRDGLLAATDALVRFLGAVALAGARGDVPDAASAHVGELVRRTLDEGEHLELARAVCGSGHAVPELAAFLGGAGGARLGELVEVLRAARRAGEEEAVRRHVARAVPLLGEVLAELDWLRAMRLLVPRLDVAEEWRGTARTEVTAVALPVGRPVLTGGAAPAPLALWPVAQVASPQGARREELFLLCGASRGAALLVALPGGFERRDDEARAWLIDRFGDVGAAEPTLDEDDPPYLGLAPFAARDAGRFFGREREIEACRNRLRLAPLLVIVGPSGAGKSSFVHAGLAAGLAASWRVVTLRPGAAPVATLAAKLAPALGVADPGALADELTEDPASAGAFIAAAGGAPTLVVVDQLEELFTLGAPAASAAGFVEALAAMADSDGAVRVVCTLRDDFLVRAGALPGLGPRLARSVHLLGAPGHDELLRIVREPARLAGFEFDDPELPLEMVRDVTGRPGALALLSFTAARLWEARDLARRQLRRSAYQAMGGVGGALGQHAEATLARRPERDRRLVREAFRQLVTADGTRARRPRRELAELVGVAVVDALVDARLLVVDEEEVVEVAHEALFAAWPRAVAWRRDDAEGARLRDEIRDRAQRWQARGRPPSLLLHGEDLDEIQRWQARGTAALPATDRAFVAASGAAASRRRRLARAAAFVVTFALAALALVYYTLYDRARVQGRLAASRLAALVGERDALVLRQARSAVDTDPTAALAWLQLYAATGDDWAAVQTIAVDAWSRGAARRVLRGHENAVWTVAWSPDGKTMVSGSWDHTLRLWDLATGTSRVLAGHTGEVNGVAFTADGRTVVSASDDGTVRAWGVAGGSGREVAHHGGVVSGVAAFAAGHRIVSGGSDGVLHVVDLDTGAQERVGDGRAGAIQKLALSPDGTTVATVGEGAHVWLWPVAGGAPRRLEGHVRRATGVTFAPDGQWLASADIEGNVRLWDLRSQSGRVIGAHRGMVRTLAFSPDGRLLVTGGYDETVSVWDLAGGRRVLRGHRGPVYGVAFSPDGKSLATVGLDRQIRIWDTPDRGRVFTGFSAGQGETLVFAPDGASLAYTAGNDLDVVRLDNGATVVLTGGARPERAIAFAPDGAHLAAVDEEGTVRVWDLATGVATVARGANAGQSSLAFASADALVFPVGKTVVRWRFATDEREVLATVADVPRTLRALPGGQVAAIAGNELWLLAADRGARKLGEGESLLVSVAVGSDGRSIATGDHASVIELWDTARGPGPILRGHTASLEPLAFSADMRLLVSGGYDMTARAWPLAGGEPKVFAGHRTIVRHVVVSPDGRFAASSGNDEFIRTWDLRDGASGARAAHDGAVQDLALSPDGRWLASAGADGTVRLWGTEHREHVPADGPALVRWLSAATSATVSDVDGRR